MNESLDQQTGHRPAPSTGSRQVGQSCGSATSSTSPKLARKALLSRAKRLAGTVSPCMEDTLTPQVADLNGVAGNCGVDWCRCAAIQRRLCTLGVVMKRRWFRRTLSSSTVAANGRFGCALDLGTPTDAVRRVLAASGKVGTIIAADALAGGAAVARRRVRESMAQGERPGQGERTSERMLGVQFVNDLPGTLIQIRRALKPDGLFLAALAGGDTLTELRQAFAAAEAEIEDGISPRVVPFSDVRDMGALLQRAGFALPVTDFDRVTARYASPISLMHDLRRMG